MDNTEEKCGCTDHNSEDGCCRSEEHDCGCGHDHDKMPTVTLTLDDDSELECSILGNFNIGEVEYIALLPVDDEEVLIYRYEEVDGEVALGLIESDEEFESVLQTFNEVFDLEEDDEAE